MERNIICDVPLPPEIRIQWWCRFVTEPVGMPHAVAFGFVRIITSARVFNNPLTPSEASGHVRSWLTQPPAQILQLYNDHIEHVLASLEKLGTAGNLVTDAQIAALAIEMVRSCTRATRILRFTGLRWFNPLTGAGNAKKR